ncbi:MAG: hypothetical protein J0I14_01910 [Propionibacteriaceae bacterium]|jgi:Flp pilus assembly pilin Flp|nr:hypothetical protein [Propionibacteriaceae bacterium]
MKHLIALQLAIQQLLARATELRLRNERGATTVEYVLWTAFAVLIVGVAIAVITGYVNTQLAKIG